MSGYKNTTTHKIMDGWIDWRHIADQLGKPQSQLHELKVALIISAVLFIWLLS